MNWFHIPLEQWTNDFVEFFLLPVLGPIFESISHYIGLILDQFENFLTWVPQEIMTAIIVLLAWWTKGLKVAVFSFIGLLYIGSVDLWKEAMQTLAVVLSATFLSILIGIPFGIWSAKSRKADQIIRPILDFMQTLPSFVYLIPTVLLFGVGPVPAVIATFVFATPPAVRLTSLGIKQVPIEVIEAAKAFGSTSWQMLVKVQLPIAKPTIMAGINQTIMMSLAMAVISAMIGAPGLGSVVLQAITRVNVGMGLVGGLGIVFLAIILDRITEGLGRKQK
ncbi:ABC transporter permease [Tepidibacillus fermentans]|uniref:Glycine betaine/proline transport system permease protein n=1 Tax=Tepidibacillus fermentans TaxID=1281767 RepID=A0A4R3KL95_9BACI|nr:proline/glycine betaine ABC transporter permease [Tepidibacillus fermentans]TCS84350.1 glycine betaine/proline transport system permease protein [Tepidibacillus fermentans]